MADTALELEVEFVTTPPLEVDLVGSYNVPPAPSSFASLTDVQLTDPQNGQVPKYNSETQKWENADESGGVSNFADLSDVNFDNVQNGQVAKYDSETQKWINADDTSGVSTFADLSDVDLDNLTTGQIPKYNSETEKWENADEQIVTANPAGTATTTLEKLQVDDTVYAIPQQPDTPAISDLTDVDIDSPTNGQVLKYNSTTEMWENGTGGGGGASAMSDLTDVDLTDLADGASLVYDDDEDEWKPQTITKEVTQAEYDALVQAGTIDANTVYFIKDTNGDGSKFQPVIYSEEEREIGVWTDGKPLYEKTLPFGAVQEQSSIRVSADLGIDELVNFSGVAHASTYNQWISVNFTHQSFPKYLVNAGYDGNAKEVFIYTGKEYPLDKGYVTLRYTKSTDTAGSGTWTPQGVPSHHYSTSEQVVGTWIDGKTVYERVFVLDTPLTIHSGSWGTTSISNAGMDTVIDGTGITASGTNWAFLGFAVDTGNYVNVLNTRNSDITLKTILLRYTKTSS